MVRRSADLADRCVDTLSRISLWTGRDCLVRGEVDDFPEMGSFPERSTRSQVVATETRRLMPT